MTKTLTSRQLAHLNLAICEEFNTQFEICRPHNLLLIEKQQKQLAQESRAQRAAHAAYMIRKLQPFATGNARTALLAAAVINDKSNLPPQLAGLIKHEADVNTLSGVLRA